MKRGKALGLDIIPIEAWISLEEAGVGYLTSLFNKILAGERMPDERRKNTLLPIYKNKGDSQDFVNCEGYSNAEVKRRVQAGWNEWRKVTGVLRDKNMPIGVKGTIYRTCARPALLYGMETAPVTKSQEAKIEVAEMRMLRTPFISLKDINRRLLTFCWRTKVIKITSLKTLEQVNPTLH
ncbi:uncharacterized protein LOC122250126 [Penaeus japonicus]|uniref:uncharacterized protein LOC122250126 n=1 Tax=Penaeus japonicus TaxID=27405 RepID=UPI001C70C1A6|nr:uncharacterized protein LOC122250126 [Penaeus japonicus]